MIGVIHDFGKEILENIKQETDERNRSGRGKPISRTRKKTIKKYKNDKNHQGEEKND